MAVAENGEAVEAEAVPNGDVPGGVTAEELGLLYRAAKIENRALNEQIAARDQLLAGWSELGGRLLMLLNLEDLDAIFPAVEELTKNRQQRRSSRTPKKSPAVRGGKKAALEPQEEG